jgi:hypothetical protein
MRGWVIVGYGILNKEHVSLSPSVRIDALCKEGWCGLLVPYFSSTGYSLSEEECCLSPLETQKALIWKRLGISNANMAVLTDRHAIAEKARWWSIPVTMISEDQPLKETIEKISQLDIDLCIVFVSDLPSLLQTIDSIIDRPEMPCLIYISVVLSFYLSHLFPSDNYTLHRIDEKRFWPPILQSYAYREGRHLQVDCMQVPSIAINITCGSEIHMIRHRKDGCQTATLMEVAQKGGMQRLALAQYLPELAFRLGKLPKYGA